MIGSTRARRRAFWLILHLAAPVFLTGVALSAWRAGQGWSAVTAALTALVLAAYAILNLAWYRQGYRRGMDDFAEAAVRSESSDEFLRLTLGVAPPRPWD